ncbi:hypothetical protein [Amycolatopsis solani]|uniref:hypothetical protein n=1 Tax=Amycolatopsis solani TaxID=3028615 RepID=UPI0025AF21FB|nr:hypothetical protein [Amycolatopsis sp. MEP2-6]
MRDDVRVAKTVVMALGFVLIALGVAAGGALLLLAALASGGRDWVGAGPAFTLFAAAAAWTVLAGGLAVWSARRASRLAGLFCVVLGAVPAAVVAFAVR